MGENGGGAAGGRHHHTFHHQLSPKQRSRGHNIFISAANQLIGEVVQSRRRPLLGPHLRHY